MAQDKFADVALGAVLAEGLQKLGDAVETFRMEVEEFVRENSADETQAEPLAGLQSKAEQARKERDARKLTELGGPDRRFLAYDDLEGES